MTSRRVLPLFVAGAFALAACSSGSSSEPSPAAPRYRPTFRAGPCERRVPASPRITCGVLTVPEDRAHPGRALVQLPVAVIHSAAANPAPDPIVYFEGGPGYSGLDSVGLFLRKDLGGGRDVILFDQRGTGSARPGLDCPEFNEAAWGIFATADPARAEQSRLEQALLACRRRLVASGVRLSAYTTSASAADAADLRVAMGIRRWNLFGVSYGTTLALVSMREHPEGVRSVVVDSVLPTTAGVGGATLAGHATRVFRTFYEGCAAAPACASAHPRLEQESRALIARLNAQPYHGEVTDPDTGRRRPIVITGNDAVAGEFVALYDSSLIPLLPTFIRLLEQGNTAIIDGLAVRGIPFLVGASEAMTVSVSCHDWANVDAGRSTAPALRARPEYATLLLAGDYTSFCPRWGVPAAPAAFNRPVKSNLPTLVLADEYDPITPPANSRSAAQALPRSTFVEFPGLGHGAVFAHPCPESIFRAFVANPSSRPDTACVARMGPPQWAT